MPDTRRETVAEQDTWSSRKACLEHVACGFVVWGTPMLGPLSEWAFLKKDQPHMKMDRSPGGEKVFIAVGGGKTQKYVTY